MNSETLVINKVLVIPTLGGILNLSVSTKTRSLLSSRWHIYVCIYS